MDVKTINPFVEATCTVFETMIHCTPKMQKLRLPTRNDVEEEQITAVIGLSGTVRGAVAIAVPADTAQKIAQRLLMSDQPRANAEVFDALGEVANMIAGSAKAKLKGHQIFIGLPTVIHGLTYVLEHPQDSMTLVVPFESELGEFTLNVTLGGIKVRGLPRAAAAR